MKRLSSATVSPVRGGRATSFLTPSAGFTLIELLTAVAVAAGLSILAFSVANGFLAAWTRSTARISVQEKSRFVLDRVASDLQSAIWRRDGKTELVATVLDRTDNSGLWLSAALQKPSSVNLVSSDSRDLCFGEAGMWIQFFTAKSGTNDSASSEATAGTISAPVAVAYQLIRRMPPTGSATRLARYCLHRSEVRAAEMGGRSGTLECGYDLDPVASAGVYGAGGDPIVEGDPGSLQRPESANTILADEVIDFGIKIWARDGDGNLRSLFPVADTDREFSLHAMLGQTAADNPLPSTIDIFVRVLSPEGAVIIEALESGKLGPRPSRFSSNGDWWWELARANSEMFSRRVELIAPSP